MEPFLYWLFRASVLMVLFYGLYKFFFANNTFHSVNRFSLISTLLVILALPFFRFNLIPEKQPESVAESLWMDFSSLPVIEYVEVQPRVEVPWMQIILVLYLLGFVFTVTRYIIGLSQIIAIIRQSERQTIADHVVMCVINRDISPFSWMKYIVLSRKELSVDNQAVIRHERAHIHLRHSLDMLFFDVFTCIFWFNPFSWLLRREIQSVHEYQADEQVLKQGIDSKQYQLLLIRKSVGDYKFALANNFHQRDLHKRITMMKKNKTNRRVKWSYAMALPVLFMAMIVLSAPKLNATAVGDQSQVLVSGIVNDEQGKIVGALVTIKGSTKGTITDLDGNFRIKTDIGSTLQFSMINYKTVEYLVEKEENNLVVVLVPEETISGDNKSGQDEVKVIGSGSIDNLQGSQGEVTIRTVEGEQPLYIVDGKTISDTEFQKIKVDDIESISVLKDKKSTIGVYGDKGKDGVILITTRKNNSDVVSVGSGSMDSLRGDVGKIVIKARDSSSQDLDPFNGHSPLIVVDGEKMPKDFKLNTIDPNDIESISVLKDNSGTQTYGDEGKDGVVIIKKR